MPHVITEEEAIDDHHWHQFKQGLKGRDVITKLKFLQAYLRMCKSRDIELRRLRVTHYLGFMSREGYFEGNVDCQQEPLALLVFIKIH